MSEINHPTVTVIVPIYNESEQAISGTIHGLIQNLDPLAVHYDIILVDDGSDQPCSQTIGSWAAKYEQLSVITNPYNLGYSTSLKKGIQKASGEYILIIDADGSYPTDTIPELFAHREKYDMVVGARTGLDVSMPFVRKVVKTMIRWLATLLVGKKIPDLNSGLRLFRKSDVLKFFHLLPSRFSFTITLTLAFLTNDLTIKYVPVNYYQRIGKSSIRPIQDTIEFFFLVFRIIMYFKPLRFFIVPAFLLLGLGLMYLGWGVVYKEDILDGAIMLIVVGFQVLFTGFLADIIIKQKLKE